MSRRRRVVSLMVLAGGFAAAMVLLVPVGLFAVWALVVKPRLAGWVEEAAEGSFDADVEIGEVGVDLFSAFPRVSVSLSSLSVKGRAPFEGVELVKLGPTRLDVDALSALGSDVRIEGLHLQDPSIHVVVLPDGRSNLDTFGGGSSEPAPGSTDSTASSGSLSLDDVEITGMSLVYDDREGGLRAAVSGLDLALEGIVGTPTRFDVTAKVASTDVTSGGTPYLDHAAIDAHVELEQAADGTLTFADNAIRVNTFPLAFGGTIAPVGDASRVDVTFRSPESSLPGLLSLLPGATSGSLASVKTAGTVAFEGSVKGVYPGADPEALPAFDLALRLADASFRFPDQPVGVDRLALDLALHHPEGPAGATEIDARSFELAVADQSVSGRLSVRDPLGDPAVDTAVKGSVDLAALRSSWPAVADSTPPAGRLTMDFELKGRASALAEGRADQVTCSGSVKGSGIRYTAEGWPDVTIERFGVTLSPEAVSLDEAALSWQDSDVTFSGRLEQLVPFLVRGDTLVGRMTVNSPSMDLRPFQGGEDSTTAASEPSSDEGAIAPVPTWCDLRLDAAIGHLVTEEFEMDRFEGTVLVKDGEIRMDPVEADMLGGRVTLRGTYRAPDTSGADVGLEVTAVRMNLGRAFSTFETLERVAPVLKGVQTTFDSGFSMQGRLERDGSPDLATLVSKGMFLPAAAELTPKALQAVGQQLHDDRATSLRVGGTRIGWAVEGGKAKIDAFTAKLGPLDARVAGTAGVVDRTLDFEVSTTAPIALPDAVAGKGKKAKGKDAGGAEVVATIGGTWDDPTVKVSIGGASPAELVQDAARELVGEAAGDLLAEASRKGDALIAAAEEQAARLKAEAKANAKKLDDEASKKSKRLVDEAGNNPVKVAAAKEAGKKLEKDAKAAGDKLIAEADRAGQKGITEAKAKKAELIAEAEKKSGAKR